jgi:hypothetical protein
MHDAVLARRTRELWAIYGGTAVLLELSQNIPASYALKGVFAEKLDTSLRGRRGQTLCYIVRKVAQISQNVIIRGCERLVLNKFETSSSWHQ